MNSWLDMVPVDREIAACFDALPDELNELGYDQWGFNPEAAKRYYTLGKWIWTYFRPQVHGIENIPDGRVLLIPNHSGQFPLDGMVTAMACLLKGQPPRVVRSMAERWFPTLPFINLAFSRSGVVVGDPINCKNLLEADNAILVFPEGARGCGKPWARRYQLEKFGRGFMRLALQTNTPIVPIAIIGAEESIPSMFSAGPLARLVGAPYFPVPPHLPLLGPLAYLPLPTQFHIHFGTPLRFDGPFDDEDEVIEENVTVVRDTVQDMVNRGLTLRESVF